MSGGWRESALARSVHSDTASCRYTPCCHGNIVAVDHLLINCLCKKCWKDGLERWSCTVCPNVLHLTFLLFLSCSSLLPFCLLIILPYLPPSFSSSLFPSLSLSLSPSQRQRSHIPCYWETQPMGCLKPHCPFKHSKPRPPLPGTFDRLTQYEEKGGMESVMHLEERKGGMGEGERRDGREKEGWMKGEKEREWRVFPSVWTYLLIARTKFSDFSNQRHYR